MGNGGKLKSKSKRQSKKNPGKFKKTRKDPGVPAECPFKDQVLAEAQQAIEQRNESLEKRRLELKKCARQTRPGRWQSCVVRHRRV